MVKFNDQYWRNRNAKAARIRDGDANMLAECEHLDPSLRSALKKCRHCHWVIASRCLHSRSIIAIWEHVHILETFLLIYYCYIWIWWSMYSRSIQIHHPQKQKWNKITRYWAQPGIYEDRPTPPSSPLLDWTWLTVQVVPRIVFF